MAFSQPSAASGGEFEPRNFNGRLLMIYAKHYNPEVQTKFGPSQAADVDVIVVDQQDPTTGKPVIALDAKLFGNLAKSVRNDVGGVVLGRLGQVPTANGNPAWVLENFTDADASMAGPIDQAYRAGQFRQPSQSGIAAQNPLSAATPPPAQDPWAAVSPPVASPAAPPTPAATPPASTVDPALVAFLASKGVQVTPQMDQATCEAIARSFPA
ncbi:hypothetical protein ACWD2L_06170 [Streptomyces sp. NPDC002754]